METQDIYTLQQERSRRGCLWTVVVAGALGVALGGVYGWRAWKDHAAGIGAADPVEFPGGAVEEELPAAEVPEVPASAESASAGEAESAAASEAETAAAEPEVEAKGEEDPAAVAAAGLPEPSGGDAGALLAAAEGARAAGDLAGARAKGLEAWAAAPGDARVEGFLGQVDMELLRSDAPMAEKTTHEVVAGDYLGKLAAKYNTPVGLIRAMNGLKGDTLRLGQRLTVFDGNGHQFAVKVSKTRNDLLLTLDGQFFKRYRVSTGAGGRTPAGTFRIVDKIEHPTWYRSGGTPVPYGDPENLLGTHWLALDVQGYGIHGTWEPESLGKQSSAGCVRLLNEEVEELYHLLPKGTPVTVEE